MAGVEYKCHAFLAVNLRLNISVTYIGTVKLSRYHPLTIFPLYKWYAFLAVIQRLNIPSIYIEEVKRSRYLRDWSKSIGGGGPEQRGGGS